MNKLIIAIVAVILMSGCAKTIQVRDSLATIDDTARHDTQRPKIYWFDTKQTLADKLEQADAEIIIMHNKLVTVREQLRNLNTSLDRRSRLRKLLSGH